MLAWDERSAPSPAAPTSATGAPSITLPATTPSAWARSLSIGQGPCLTTGSVITLADAAWSGAVGEITSVRSMASGSVDAGTKADGSFFAMSGAAGSAIDKTEVDSTKSTLPKLSSARCTSGARSRRWRRIERVAGDIAGSMAIHSCVSTDATRSTGAATDISSSANSATSMAGGSASAMARALAARTGGATSGRIARSRAIAAGDAGTRRRPIRSTSCRHADCAPNGDDMSAASTVSRLSSKRTVATSPTRRRRARVVTIS